MVAIRPTYCNKFSSIAMRLVAIDKFLSSDPMYFSIGVIQSNKIMKHKYAYYRIKSKKKKRNRPSVATTFANLTS
jgi:hypothetical protein